MEIYVLPRSFPTKILGIIVFKDGSLDSVYQNRKLSLRLVLIVEFNDPALPYMKKKYIQTISNHYFKIERIELYN